MQVTVPGMADTLPTFGAYLRAAVDRNHELDTLAGLAQKSGISQSVISRWSRGETTPSVENARALAQALHRPLLEVLVAAGIVTEEEAAVAGNISDLTELSDEDLLAELRTRMTARHVADTEADLARDPELSGRSVTQRPAVRSVKSTSGRRRA
jgi:transcriptional regulator with XRE-family HTH domain